MSAIESLLTGLIDYAGLYPPAALDMRTAVRNYLDYRSGSKAFALGRLIVDAARLEELWEAAGGSISRIPLSDIVAADSSGRDVEEALSSGFSVESIEVKCNEPLTICRISESLPLHLDRYFEIPTRTGSSGSIDALASVGARAKLRMGGLTQEAFPPATDVLDWLHIVADRRVPFKATAGLHHPVRSRHRLTYATDSPSGLMHGFINLFCAAALAYDGEVAQAKALLQEENPAAFHFMPEALSWRSREWTAEHVRQIRQRFFTSFGSCSFVEPLQDLEALGWL